MDEYLIGLIGNLEEGPIGPGDWLPSGGNSGDVLRKNSDADYDAGWYAASSQPTADAVALFDANGNLKSGTPVEDEDVVTLYAFRNSELATEVQQIKAAFDADLAAAVWSPNITRGSYIKVLDGTVASSNKYARTALWNGYGKRKAVIVDNPVYEFCLALYDETGNLDGTGYLRSTGYATGMQYIPQDAAMFGVSFRRVDQSALTADDSTAISAALSALAATDTNLNQPGAAADAEATGNAINETERELAYIAPAIPTFPVGFVSGGISTTTGSPTDDTTRIRSNYAYGPMSGSFWSCSPEYAIRLAIYNGASLTTSNFVRYAGEFKSGIVMMPFEDRDKYAAVVIEKVGHESDDITADLATIADAVKYHRGSQVDDIGDRVTYAERNIFTEALSGTPYNLVTGDIGSSGTDSPGSGKACRTPYISVPSQNALVVFEGDDADNYTMYVWSYSGTTGGSATHVNGLRLSAALPREVGYVDGDNHIRVAFRRKDYATLTTDLSDPASDYSIIRSALKIYVKPSQGSEIDGITQDSINLVDMSALSGTSAVNVLQNADGSVTFTTNNTSGSYVSLKILGAAALKPGTQYCLRMRITDCSATDSGGNDKTPAIALRFKGDWDASGGLSGGIRACNEPGDYTAMWLLSGFQTELDLVLTGSASGDNSVVTISELMVAEADYCIPYVPYGVTAKDNIASAYALSNQAERTTWGVANVVANARQFTQVKYTLRNNLPTQFSTHQSDFNSGKTIEGLPYSSARYYERLVGIQVSLHTFLSCVYNPRSVIYTRQLTTSNSKTYYGCVCSAFASHNFGILQNFSADTYTKWNRMQEIPFTALKVGDVADNTGHILLVTDVNRDKYGRIISVNYSEAGTPVVHRIMAADFDGFSHFTGYKPYRYLDIDNVQYAASPFVKGYPDETPEYEDTANYPWPDIMCEFGDKVALMRDDPQFENGQVTINVLDAEGYDTITVSVDGALKSTMTGALADFRLTLDEGGLWEISMTGPNKSSTTSFIVVDATCSYDDNHVAHWQVNSGNATLIGIYTYGWQSEASRNIRNNYTWPTGEELGSTSGSKDLSEYLTRQVGDITVDCSLGAKISFLTDYGIATWLSTPEIKLWEAVT